MISQANDKAIGVREDQDLQRVLYRYSWLCSGLILLYQENKLSGLFSTKSDTWAHVHLEWRIIHTIIHNFFWVYLLTKNTLQKSEDS